MTFHIDQAVSPEWRARVNRVVDHVRSNLDDELKLADLARLANSSPFHFHRIFAAVVGESPASFVRRARLERSAHLMMASPNRSLSSIAADLGFASLSEFSRSFRKLYGVSPSSWDRTTRLALDETKVVPAGWEQSDGRVQLQPMARIIYQEPMRLAYVRAKGLFGVDDLTAEYDSLMRWAVEQGVDTAAERLIGMSWDNYETTPVDRLHYDFAITIPTDVEPDGLVSLSELPAMTAVAVRCCGGLDRIAQAWDYLYEDWFPGSRHSPADLPGFKFFHRRPDEIGWDRWNLDCVIALEPE
ncbi:MAG: AraC family transcriptional regulator [Acidimicrobiales bacterium]